jgi:hypothetical protein
MTERAPQGCKVLSPLEIASSELRSKTNLAFEFTSFGEPGRDPVYSCKFVTDNVAWRGRHRSEGYNEARRRSMCIKLPCGVKKAPFCGSDPFP